MLWVVIGTVLGCIILKGCGLPSFIVIEPPSVISQEATLDKVAFKTVHDDGAMEGYEIYYKFYLDYNSAELLSDKNAIEESDITGSSLLKNRGYLRLQRQSGTGKESPLVSIETTDSRKISMDFSELNSQNTVSLTANGGQTNLPFDIGRYYSDGEGVPLGFSESDINISSDGDLYTIRQAIQDDNSLDDGSVAVAFYVYKQALLLDTFDILFSTPQYLGVIDSLAYTN